MSTNRRNLEIPLAQLAPGMFVIKLDIPWMQSPFFKHSRLISSSDDIAKLRSAGVKVVTIDLERGSGPQAPNKPIRQDKSTSAETVSSPSAELHTLSEGFRKELQVAERLRSEIRNVVRDMNEKLDRNLPADTQSIVPLVDQTLASLQRNQRALQTFVHLTGKSQKLIDHAFGIFCLALNLATVLKVPKEQMTPLGLAALLHDSGWLQLPLHLMGKRADYSVAEKKLMQSHVDLGLRVLSSSGLDELTRRIIAEHHELCDGSGYPCQLTKEAIHPVSQILSVVNTYDEWVHQLADKPGMLPTKALRTLYRLAEEGKYSLECVAGLISLLGVYPVTTAVLLNTGEKAVVEEVHADAHLTPVVRIEYDQNNRPLRVPLKQDLRLNSAENRSIVAVLDPSNPADDPAQRLRAVVPE